MLERSYHTLSSPPYLHVGVMLQVNLPDGILSPAVKSYSHFSVLPDLLPALPTVLRLAQMALPGGVAKGPLGFA